MHFGFSSFTGKVKYIIYLSSWFVAINSIFACASHPQGKQRSLGCQLKSADAPMHQHRHAWTLPTAHACMIIVV